MATAAVNKNLIGSIIFEGYLLKKSKYLRSARKRWIVLTKNCLYSFKEKNEYQCPTEVIDLNIYDQSNSDYDSAKDVFELEIFATKTKAKRWFIAESYEEGKKWQKVIKRTQDVLHKRIYKCDSCGYI